MTEMKDIYPVGSRHKILAIVICMAAMMILLIAWGFQIIGGYVPCPLCLEQRYAYYFAIPLSIIACLGVTQNWLAIIVRCLFILLALSFFYSAVSGFYQAGAEWGMWQGPSECAGGILGEGVGDDLMTQMANTRIVRCDEASWRFLSLSFAGWNALLAMMLAMISGVAAFMPGGKKSYNK